MENNKEAIKEMVDNATKNSQVLPSSGIELNFLTSFGDDCRLSRIDGIDITDEKRTLSYLKAKEIEAICRLAEAQERTAKALEKMAYLEKQKQKTEQKTEQEREAEEQMRGDFDWRSGV